MLNASASRHRSTVRRRRRESAVTRLAPTATDQPAPAVDAHRALGQLSEQQRAIVFLTYWEDQSPAQVADLLGVTEGTVRKQLARAREHLRRILDV